LYSISIIKENNTGYAYLNYLQQFISGEEQSSQSDASNSHDTLQRWYEHVELPEMEQAYIEWSKEWNSHKAWESMDSEEEQEELMRRDEDGMSSDGEKPEILTIRDKEHVQKVEVKNEPMPP